MVGNSTLWLMDGISLAMAVFTINAGNLGPRLGPYYIECTSSRPITEVKQCKAWTVL